MNSELSKMRFRRDLSSRVTDLAGRFPAVVLPGGRQVGKTTLLRAAFPDHRYVSLDLPSDASIAEHSPATFFAAHVPPVVSDGVQCASGLVRHGKRAVD